MNKRIVYTRFDGGVSICCPADDAIAWMGCGGYWNDYPRGFMDVQIERQIKDGRDPDAARRFAHAMQFGGCTTAEALEIIRDRDCAHLGTAIELWDDVPTDRWFRNAWYRSHNGGPICVSLKLAKPLQFKHILAAVDTETQRRKTDIDLFDVPVDVDLLAAREKIRQARDEHELRAIWPVGLRSQGFCRDDLAAPARDRCGNRAKRQVQ